MVLQLERTIVIFQGRKIFDQRIPQFFDGEEGFISLRCYVTYWAKPVEPNFLKTT